MMVPITRTTGVVLTPRFPATGLSAVEKMVERGRNAGDPDKVAAAVAIVNSDGRVAICGAAVSMRSTCPTPRL